MRFFYARANNKSLLPIERSRLDIDDSPLGACERPVDIFCADAPSANNGKTAPFPFAARAIVAISPLKRRRRGNGNGRSNPPLRHPCFETVMGRGAAGRRNSARYKFDKAAAGPAGFARYPDLTIRRPLRWKTRGSRVLSAIAIRCFGVAQFAA